MKLRQAHSLSLCLFLLVCSSVCLYLYHCLSLSVSLCLSLSLCVSVSLSSTLSMHFMSFSVIVYHELSPSQNPCLSLFLIATIKEIILVLKLDGTEMWTLNFFASWHLSFFGIPS